MAIPQRSSFRNYHSTGARHAVPRDLRCSLSITLCLFAETHRTQRNEWKALRQMCLWRALLLLLVGIPLNGQSIRYLRPWVHPRALDAARPRADDLSDKRQTPRRQVLRSTACATPQLFQFTDPHLLQTLLAVLPTAMRTGGSASTLRHRYNLLSDTATSTTLRTKLQASHKDLRQATPQPLDPPGFGGALQRGVITLVTCRQIQGVSTISRVPKPGEIARHC